jgi:hypothetical protein
MKKLGPYAAVLLLAGVLAVVVYYATRPAKPVDPPVNGCVVPKNETFKIDDFMFNFDHDSDGKVTFEEFTQRYGQGDPPLVFTKEDGADPMSAADAFKQWDRNRNGSIDTDDIRQLEDKEWLAYAQGLARQGLQAVTWNGVQYGLNEHQLRTFNAETGALARKELPFAGAFWDTKYFGGRWSRVSEPEKSDVLGYLHEGNGRLFILTEKAELQVKDPARVQISQLPADDPHMLYAAEIAKTAFDEPDKNLELARKCKQWGMVVEAGMLYARVLIFRPGDKESLDALGYRLDGPRFVPKGQ